MIKYARLLSILLLVLVLTPVALANEDEAIRLKSATVETRDSVVEGEITVCNTERERVRFVLDVKNLTINSLYKRKLSVDAGDCETTKLRFTKNFAEMSNVGDEISFTAKQVRGMSFGEEYDFSNSLTVKVTKGTKDKAGCGDQTVKDGTVIGACDMDFIYHDPSGLRIKVTKADRDYVELKLTHVEWGGVQEMRIYKGRSKKIRSNYDELKRVEITNLWGENKNDLFLKIES